MQAMRGALVLPCLGRTIQHGLYSNRLATNIFLYQLQLQRHSDHHANPMLRFQALRHCETAPQLPAGYATMIVLALFPALWCRVMDHRVLQHYGGDRSLANVQPTLTHERS